jgi:hypothetical protein
MAYLYTFSSNLAHLLILCVFTSVLYGVNKEVKENNNNKKTNPILAFYIQIQHGDDVMVFEILLGFS